MQCSTVHPQYLGLRAALIAAREDKKLATAIPILAIHSIDSYHVESVNFQGRTLNYVNRGDSYLETVCEENGEFFLSSWGGWLEIAETSYCLHNAMIRCGYCGEFTPKYVGIDWREVTCQQCGHNVATGE